MNKTKKAWGNEIEIVNTKDYCGKLLNLKQGYCCSLHYHKKKDETFYVNTGCIVLQVDQDNILLGPGDSIRIKPGTKHRFYGVVDSQIIEFSTHHEDKDSIRETKSGKMMQGIYFANKKMMEEVLKEIENDKSIHKKRILVDFDRVIHQYRKGWNGGKPYDKPVDGSRDAIIKLLEEGWDIVVFTAYNPEDPKRIDKIKVWLKKYKFPELEVTHTKLSSIAIIDDRAIRFEGNWRSILNYFM